MGPWGLIIFICFGFLFFYIIKTGSLRAILQESLRGLKNSFIEFQNEGWMKLKEGINELWERFRGRNG